MFDVIKFKIRIQNIRLLKVAEALACSQQHNIPELKCNAITEAHRSKQIYEISLCHVRFQVQQSDNLSQLGHNCIASTQIVHTMADVG
jgi:hypothetical protein